MNPAVPLAALSRPNIATDTTRPSSVGFGEPTYNPSYGCYQQQQQPTLYGVPQNTVPQYQAYQPYQPPYQPYQQQQQYAPDGGTAILVQPTPNNQHQGSGGFWSNQKIDFGITDDKLITTELDVSIRHAFVRKVYGILSIQLLITFGMALVFNVWDAAGYWLRRHWWLSLIAVGFSLVCIIVLTCVPGVARSHPLNLILLFLIAVSFGVILGFACVAVSTSSFAIAAGITAAVSISLSIFACQTKWDFTGCGVFVFVSVIVLMIFGFMMIFIRNRIAQLVYASLGALLFSFYMVYDTQQIVGGKHRKFQYSIDDYTFAALTLYMDVINLFMFILTLVSHLND